MVTNSGEVYILGKIADLSLRCGVSPTTAPIGLYFEYPDGQTYHYNLAAYDARDDDEKGANVRKLWDLLGLDDFGHRRLDTLNDVEQLVDSALAKVGRARHR